MKNNLTFKITAFYLCNKNPRNGKKHITDGA